MITYHGKEIARYDAYAVDIDNKVFNNIRMPVGYRWARAIRNRIKNKLHKTTFRKCWLYTLKKSGIKHCVFHDLRHTFCSNMIVNVGVDFETVMSLTGHKSLSMLKRYTHTNKNAKKEAVKKLENHLELPIYSHNLVTSNMDEKVEDSKVVNLSSLNH